MMRGGGQATLKLDFNIHSCGEIELHQPIDCLGGQVLNVYQPLVGSELKLLTRILVDVRGAEHGVNASPAKIIDHK